MAETKVERIPTELTDALREQLGHLQRSANAYDAGEFAEAKRIATAVRLLVHDTRKSHSLLGQLNLLNRKFLSTATHPEAGNLLPYSGLIAVSLDNPRWRPLLDTAPEQRGLSFHEWWSEQLFVDGRMNLNLTRQDLVTFVANQDGGAHVDPKLDQRYAILKHNDGLDWVFTSPGGTEERMVGAIDATLRQIGHEVLRTVIPNYRKSPPPTSGSIFAGFSFAPVGPAHASPPPARFGRVGRNDPCPCGSARKFKKCHGSALP